MRIDFSTVMCDIKGNPIKESTEENAKDVTLSTISCTALLNSYPDEQNLPVVDKLRRYKLASKASDGGEQELSIEEVAELKKIIGKAFPPLMVGRAYEILDPNTV